MVPKRHNGFHHDIHASPRPACKSFAISLYLFMIAITIPNSRIFLLLGELFELKCGGIPCRRMFGLDRLCRTSICPYG